MRIRLTLAAALTGLLVFLLLTGGAEGEEVAALKAQGVAGVSHAPAAALPPSLELSKSGALKKGSKGKDVRELQRVLALLGFSPGKVDGVYGEQTRNAVAAFQLAYRLKPNGVLGRKTLRELNRVLAELARDGALPASAS
jgi:peptidoglycan hydrolase-like protein with peptidoglycan-binding domain